MINNLLKRLVYYTVTYFLIKRAIMFPLSLSLSVSLSLSFSVSLSLSLSLSPSFVFSLTPSLSPSHSHSYLYLSLYYLARSVFVSLNLSIYQNKKRMNNAAIHFFMPSLAIICCFPFARTGPRLVVDVF